MNIPSTFRDNNDHRMVVPRAVTMQPCMEYLDNPVNHTEAAVADGLAELRVCLEARAVLMSVLSRNNLTSLPAKAATYSYISHFGGACRYQHLPPEHSAHCSMIISHAFTMSLT